MWYSELYRRHLLDMHIEDWDPVFLSQFSPEEYVKNLKTARINYAMLYLQSHVGLCYYPSASGCVHAHFQKDPDLMKRTVDLCHQAGIRVCGYYSLIYNTREHDRHPDWRMIRADGTSIRAGELQKRTMRCAPPKGYRYGNCCPNNPDYRSFTLTQVDELLDYFELDALFFDMPFWINTCYCEHCRAAYGKPIPIEPTAGSAEHRELVAFKYRAMGEFVQLVTEHVKKRCPEMPVEYNIASTVVLGSDAGCGEAVLDSCDYVGGDLDGEPYSHSFACKYFKNASRNQPFEQMLSRCKPDLSSHTLTRSPRVLKTALASTMAHHGASLVIDAIDPVGTMDAHVYERVGEIFAFQQPYEPFYTGEMMEDVGVYYGIRSRLAGETYDSCSCSRALSRTLIRRHIPFGVTGAFYDIDRYKVLLAPMLSAMEEKDNVRLLAYVEQGGTLYLSGFGNAALVEALTGHRLTGYIKESKVYLAPQPAFAEMFGWFNEKYPMPFDSSAPLAAPGADCVVAATLTLPYTAPQEDRFVSIHSDPPGIATENPAITISRYGKGTVIWSAVPIEWAQHEEYGSLLLQLLQQAAPMEWSFATDAPADVEINAFANEDSVTVNAVALWEERGVVSPFEIRIKTPEPTAVTLLPQGEELPFVYENGYTIFQTKPLDVFDMYEIRW